MLMCFFQLPQSVGGKGEQRVDCKILMPIKTDQRRCNSGAPCCLLLLFARVNQAYDKKILNASTNANFKQLLLVYYCVSSINAIPT